MDSEQELHDHDRRVKDMNYMHVLLVGKRFADLRDDELRVLYAWKLWEDSMDLDKVIEELTWSEESKKISMALVHQQLTETFGFKADDIIEEE